MSVEPANPIQKSTAPQDASTAAYVAKVGGKEGALPSAHRAQPAHFNAHAPDASVPAPELDVLQATRTLLGPGNANISHDQLNAAIDLIVARHHSQPGRVSAEVLQMAVTAGVSAHQLAELGRPGLTRASVHAYLESCNIRWANLEDQTLAWQTHPGAKALYESRIVPFGIETELHRRIWAGMQPMDAVLWAMGHNVPIYNLQNTALSAIHFREGNNNYQDVFVQENWSTQHLGWIAHCLGVPIPPGGFERGAADFPAMAPVVHADGTTPINV